jgi:hypothetical protein
MQILHITVLDLLLAERMCLKLHFNHVNSSGKLKAQFPAVTQNHVKYDRVQRSVYTKAGSVSYVTQEN